MVLRRLAWSVQSDFPCKFASSHRIGYTVSYNPISRSVRTYICSISGNYEKCRDYHISGAATSGRYREDSLNTNQCESMNGIILVSDRDSPQLVNEDQTLNMANQGVATSRC